VLRERLQRRRTVNTLRLMDSYKNFVTYKTDRTVLRLHKKEAELLHPYFEAEMLRALATYDKKYGYQAGSAGAGGSLPRS
jgi:hypothetical protein